MRALWKQRQRMQKLGNLGVRIAMAEDRQRERCFGDEEVAPDELERCAGRVGDVFVISRSHDAQPVRFDGHLRRSQYVTRRMQCDFCAVKIHAFAVRHGLGSAGKIFAAAKPHKIERFLRRQHGAMPGAGVVGMGMRNHRPFHRSGRIDVKTTELAANAGRRGHEYVFRTHHA